MLENPINGNILLDKLKSLALPSEDFAIFGSGPMYPRGIKELGHDIDLIARGSAWEKATQLGVLTNRRIGEGKVVSLFNDQIEIFNSWSPGDWDINQLIDNADIFDGIKYVRLEDVLKWKKILGREKDLQHIKLIEEFLSKNNE